VSVVIQGFYNFVIYLARYRPKLKTRSYGQTDDTEIIVNFKFDVKSTCQKRYLDLKYLCRVIKRNRHNGHGVDSASTSYVPGRVKAAGAWG